MLSNLLVLFNLVIALSTSLANQGMLSEKRSDGETEVSVPLGQQVTLSCPLPDLSPHLPLEMSWTRDRAVLTENYHVISMDSRMNVSTDRLSYLLHISRVKNSDQGCYVCRVDSTSPSTNVCIDVLVSPDIEATSVDVTVDEGEDTTLICRASGRPQPTIQWNREDNQLINYEAQVSGPVLRLTQVRREHSGAFLCTASNNVPPAVSKRIFVTVNHSPEVRVEETLVGCEEGKDVRLVCNCFASPTPHVIWRFNNMDISHSHKYSLDREESEGLVSSGLRLRSVSSADYGFYTCVCNNSKGRRVSSLRLYRTLSISTAATPSRGNKAVWKSGSIADDDVAVTEIDENGLGSMSSAKATSIRVTVLDPFLGHSGDHYNAASSSRLFASFFYIVFSLCVF